jgi:uncharacterized protein (TIGR03435 family)
MTRQLSLVFAATLGGALAAQSFEVASIKVNASGERQMGYRVLPGGKLIIRNLPLYLIITTAYDLPFQSNRLTGGPEWIRSERYDIEGVAPAGVIPAAATDKQRDRVALTMLRNLIAERFELTLRREVKEMPVYAVVVPKNGTKLKNASIEEKDCHASAEAKLQCHIFNGGMGRGLHGDAVDISDLIVFRRQLVRPPARRQNRFDRSLQHADG